MEAIVAVAVTTLQTTTTTAILIIGIDIVNQFSLLEQTNTHTYRLTNELDKKPTTFTITRQ